MMNELDSLEQKVTKVVAVVTRLRAENSRLQQQVATLEVEKSRLQDRITAACNRLEALVDQIPEDKD